MATHIQDLAGNDAAPLTSLGVSPLSGFYVKHKEHDGTLIDVVKPENLRFTLNKKAVHTCTYEYSHAQGVSHDFVGAYRTDFELWYNDTPIMAGMHVPAVETSKGSGYSTVNGKDWKHYLERRHYPFNYGTSPLFNEVTNFKEPGAPQGYAFYYLATDVTVVAKKLLDVTLGRPYSLDITYPTLTTALGIPTDFGLALADSTMILTFIDQLSDMDPGFDYDIDFFKELRFYSPHRYDIAVVSDSSLASIILDNTTDAVIVEGPHFVNNGPIATHWMGSGAGKGGQRLGASLGAPLVEAVYRRLDGTQDYGDMRNRADILGRSMRDFSFALNPAHEIECSVFANKITDFFVLCQPGQPIWVDQDLHSHQIQSAQEIIMMDCSVNLEGECICNFGLNQIYAGTAGVNEG